MLVGYKAQLRNCGPLFSGVRFQRMTCQATGSGCMYLRQRRRSLEKRDPAS